MEPRQIEKPLESASEGQTSLPRQLERKRRFQIVKLEERIAPGGGNGLTKKCGGNGTYGGTATC